MGWFVEWKRSKIKPQWSFEAKGAIWRLFPTSSNCFVGEDRDTENRTVSFFCLDRRSGAVLWEDVQFEERWWISIEAVQDNVLLLHEYATPDLPEHKRITAVSMSTGKTLWRNDTVKFLFAAERFVYACTESFDARTFFEMDLQNGSVVREVGFEDIESLRSRPESSGIDGIEFPVPFDATGHPDLNVKRAIDKVIADTADVVQVEYLALKNVLAIAYHVKSGVKPAEQLLTQHLALVEERASRIAWRETLGTGLAAVVPDSFFKIEEYLYYISLGKRLCAIHLPRPA